MIITGTAGDDILSGADGNDRFVFGPHGGNDIIANFDVGNDVLDLRAYGFASLEDALSHAVADNAGMALVIGTDRIVLNDVTFAQAEDLSILFV
jgi:Ca2+-binding RTX toxin-like protein